MDQYYGFCMDGHLHQIKTQSLPFAQKHKCHFASHMFLAPEIDEQTILDVAFIPLPPTNCPNLAELLPFGRNIRRNKLPSEPISPFCADQAHERTPVAFLLNFEEHSDRISETKEEAKFELYNLIEDAMQLKPDFVQQVSYETLRELFLRKFWNIKHQEGIYKKFIESRYPAFLAQRVRDYVYYWLHRFTFGTIHLTRNIVRQIAAKIPEEYEPNLKKFYKGAKWYDVYEAIMEFEDSSPDSEPEYSIFGGCSTTFVCIQTKVVLLSVLVMLFGIAFYFIYYEIGLDK